MTLFDQLEKQYGLPGGLLDAVWNAESGRGRAMLSPAGAQGHFQFMPATAKQYGLSDPNDLTQSAGAAARMFSDLLKQTGGDLKQALAGYNWGIGNVQRKGVDAAPSETRNYIQKVSASMGQNQDDPWAELDAKYSRSAAPQQAGDDPWAELDKKYAIQSAQAPSPQPANSGGASGSWDTPQAQQAQQVTAADRLMRGVRDPIDGGAQLLTKMLPEGVVRAGNTLNNWLADNTGLVGRLPEGGVDQQVREAERAYQAGRGPDAGVDWLRIAGNVVSPANLAIGARAPQAATLAGRVATGALGGATSAALNPVVGDGDFTNQKLTQMAIGGTGGALVPAVTGAIGRVISPNASRNPQVQMLRNEGVQPTVGQTLGGAWNTAEEKLMSVPILGDSISAARSRAREQFNQAALNRVTAPIGQSVDEVGQAGVARAGDLVGKAYDQAKNQLGSFRLDRQGVSELQQLRTMAQNLPDETTRGQFEKVMRTVFNDVTPNGTVGSDAFKRIDSLLGRESARFSGSSDAYQQMLGDALTEARKSLTQNAYRANPKAADALKAADRAYANLVRVEGASKNALQSGGMFTPGQLGSAVRQADQSVRDRATARGTALMQDLAGAGQSVLGNKVPNSGTADRILPIAGSLGAGFVHPAIPASLLGGAALYTRPLQSLLGSAIASRPQLAEAVRESLLKTSPSLIPAGAQVGIGLLEY